jgi:multidrug efflux pump subunit AcrA (membrane-fusion protein)
MQIKGIVQKISITKGQTVRQHDALAQVDPRHNVNTPFGGHALGPAGAGT